MYLVNDQLKAEVKLVEDIVRDFAQNLESYLKMEENYEKILSMRNSLLRNCNESKEILKKRMLSKIKQKMKVSKYEWI